jgi:hypothetical protein
MSDARTCMTVRRVQLSSYTDLVMGEVRYPAYRAHLEQRTDANSAIMAFLAGAQLAAHTLKLTEGSDLLLPEVFPNVQHIRRFNLQSSLAIEILGAGESHLGAMAVPYVLAIHEDFVISRAHSISFE